MPALISDEMLQHCAVEGPWADIPDLIREKYTGLLDRVTLYWPFVPGRDEDRWRRLIATIHG
jgi:hypothetical protein